MEILPHETICIYYISSQQVENNGEVGIHADVRSRRIGDFIGEVVRYPGGRIAGENPGAVPLVSGVDVRRYLGECLRPDRERTQACRAAAQQIYFVACGQ